jgi:hypothetical protein
MLAVAGNLSRYMQMENFTYNFNFIPVAATVLYCMALGLPMALKLLMKFLGVDLFNGTFIEVRLFPYDHKACGHIWVLIHFIPDYLLRVRLPYSSHAMVLHRLLSPYFSRLPYSYTLAWVRRCKRCSKPDRP